CAGVPLMRFGTDEQRARFLPGIADGEHLRGHAITEPDSGSDAFAMRTAAVRAGDDYVLNGRQTFISNGPIADLFVAYAVPAQTPKQFGQPIGTFQAISHKLVDMRVGVEISREWLYRTAERAQKNENVTVDVSIAKLLASEKNLESALAAVQIFGGYGYTREC